MTATTATIVTRRNNGDGTYRYLVNTVPDFVMKASKVLYTHASVFPGGHYGPIVNFHKTEAAAVRKAMSGGGVVVAMEEVSA